MDLQKEREAFQECYKTSRDYKFYVRHEMSEKQMFEFKKGKYVVDCVNDGWKIWQAAIARMEVRINTLDEILLNQGEALAQAKAQAAQEWISVQDRMPEQGQKVLVFRPDAHNHPHKDPNFKICTYAGADIFINSHFEHVITHWKPLESPIEAQEPAND